MSISLEDLAKRQCKDSALAPTACAEYLQRLHYLQAAFISHHRGDEAAIVRDIAARYRATGYVSPKQEAWIAAGFSLHGC